MRLKLVRLVSVAAVMALAISLSACGKKEENVTREPIDGAGEGYEFVAKSRSITDLVGSEGYVEKAITKNGKLYVVVSSMGSETLHTIDLATNEDKTVALDFNSVLPGLDDDGSQDVIPSDEEAPTSDEADDEVSANEGTLTVTTEGETSLGEGEFGDVLDGNVGDESYEYEYSEGSSASVRQMRVCDDGSVLFMLQRWSGNKQEYSVCKMDASGNLGLLFSRDDLAEEDEYLDYFYLKEDGGMYYTKEQCVVSVDKEGKSLGEVDAGDWIYSMFVNDAGECYVTFWSQAEQTTVCKKVDFAQKTLGESLKFSAGNGVIFQTGEDTFVVAGSDAVTEINTKTDENKRLWDWINLDLFNVDNNTFTVNDDGTYSLIAADYTDDGVKYDYVTISKQAIDPNNTKKEIVYGCAYLDWDVRRKISSFNKSQDEYRIRVKQYINMDGNYNEATYNEQYARYKADLAAGTAFDIVAVDATDLNSVRLAQKGAFLDLSDFYQNTINRSDYFENILDIYKVNGKDYFAISDVNLITMIGRGDVFKGKTTWTPQDLVELRKQYPDKAFLAYGTKENACYTMIIYALNSFMDYDKGTCDFRKQEFYDLMNFANTFPKEIDYENYDEYTKLAEGDIIVSDLYLYNLNELTMYRQLMGDDAVIIGPPNNEGIRAQVIPDAMYGITAKTKVKEGCYEFLKYFMDNKTDDGMRSSSGLPVRKDAFYDMMKEAITPETYEDEDGNTVEAEYSYTIGTPSGQIQIRRPSQAEVDMVEELLTTASATIRIDDQFTKIFQEEVAPFLEGQKTPEETANVLTSRIKIYLSENE